MNDNDANPYLWKGTERCKRQKEFRDKWNIVLSSEKNLMVHAPTGIGKTICSLVPTMNYLSYKKIIIVVNRVSQHRIFVKELDKISEKKSYIHVADIISRDKMCPINDHREKKDKIKDIRSYCERLKDKKKKHNEKGCIFLERLNIKKVALLRHLRNNILSYEQVIELCKEKEYGVCPYELLNMYIKSSANVIITDYINILKPSLREIFLKKLGKTTEDIILIVDEAHNVSDKSREYLSRTMNTSDLFRKDEHKFFNSVAHEVERYVTKKIDKDNGIIQLDDSLRNIQDNKLKCIKFINFIDNIVDIKEKIDKMIDEKREKKIDIEFNKKELIDEFEDVFSGCIDDIIFDLKIIIKLMPEDDREGSYISRLRKFLIKLKDIDENKYLLYGSYEFDIKRKEYCHKLGCFCLDPSQLTKIFNEMYSTLLMSGTFSFFEMNRKVLGLDYSFEELKQKSSFPNENRLNIISNYATSKGKEGSTQKKEAAKRYAELIFKLLDIVPKNVGIFSPNYNFSDDIVYNIKRIMKEKNIDYRQFKKIIVEKRSTTCEKGEKDKDLEKFKEESDTELGAVLFASSRGNYSEGVDYLGNYMNCAIIVGVPLTQWDMFARSLISYYKNEFKKGQEYGYNLPAMNKVLQAAGRCIRSNEDRGVVIFIDDRYLGLGYDKDFRESLPDCEVYKKEQTEEMLKRIEEFYKK